MTTKSFELFYLYAAEAQIKEIEKDRARQGLIKQIKKALRHLSENPNYPGLKSHPMKNLDAVYGAKVFSSYARGWGAMEHKTGIRAPV